MDTRKLSFALTSVPDRTLLVAELWVGNDQWGEVNVERGFPVLELYPRPGGGPWQFRLAEVLPFIQSAADHLLENDRETLRV
ncbi:MAG: hypothetical protein U0X73_04050 [Thermoanaerobaculia bacterium]